MKKRIAALGIAAAVAGTAGTAAAVANHQTDPPAERAAEARYTADHLADAQVSAADAERAALALHKGDAYDTHLQTEGGSFTWEVKVDDGNRTWEVQVDAHTGKVVSDQGSE